MYWQLVAISNKLMLMLLMFISAWWSCQSFWNCCYSVLRCAFW